MEYEQAVRELVAASGWSREDVVADPDAAHWVAVSASRLRAVELGYARRAVLDGPR